MELPEFRSRLDKAKCKCEVCGHRAHEIVSHLRDAHQMTVGQYKKHYNNNTLLVCSPVVTELLKAIDRQPPKDTNMETLIKKFEFDFKNPRYSIENLGKGFGPVEPELQYLIPQVDQFFDFTELSAPISFAIERKKNIYIEGPTGCGKTAEFLQVHAVAGRPLKRMNCNGEVTVHNFIGQTLRHSQANGGGTYYKYGALPLAMMGGYSLLLDEIDYMTPPIAAVCNPVLEGEKTLYIPEMDEYIHAKDGFFIAATANTGGKGDLNGVYTGTEILNTAFLDRFPIKLRADYLEMDKEIAMLQRRFPNEQSASIKAMCKAAVEVRQSFKTGAIAITLSTRKLIDYFEQLPVFKHDKAISQVLGNWLTDDSEYQLVKDLLSRCNVEMPARS